MPPPPPLPPPAANPPKRIPYRLKPLQAVRFIRACILFLFGFVLTFWGLRGLFTTPDPALRLPHPDTWVVRHLGLHGNDITSIVVGLFLILAGAFVVLRYVKLIQASRVAEMAHNGHVYR